MAMCNCGAPECWDENDFSWLASRSGWCGLLHGCETSVFFIHGKKIREQRHIPEQWSVSVNNFRAKLLEWSAGLPDPCIQWMQDTGGGDAGLWIEGVREPNDDDLARLQETREWQRKDDDRTLAAIQKRRDDLGGPR